MSLAEGLTIAVAVMAALVIPALAVIVNMWSTQKQHGQRISDTEIDLKSHVTFANARHEGLERLWGEIRERLVRIETKIEK